MGRVTPVAENFDLGFRSDTARDQLPRGAAFRMKDWIPQLEAPERKRGGWEYGTPDLNALSGASRLSGVAWAPFASDPHLIAVSEAGKVYRITIFDGSGGSYIGSTSFSPLTHRPIFHKDRIVLLQALGATSATPQQYKDAGGFSYGLSALGGSPPQASVGASWGDYLILANGYDGATRYANRSWFSGVGNPESWNLTQGNFDFPEEIVAVAPLRNYIVVFGYSRTWLLTGDTPPPGGNLARRDLFTQVGCFDSRSVAFYREYVIWANNDGVWRSDGATLTDLTEEGGIQLYWQDLVSTFNFQNGWQAAGGVWSGFYHVTVTDNAGNEVVTLVCDIDRRVWFEFTNVPAAMFAERSSGPGTSSTDGHSELFFAHRTVPRAGMISPVWNPTSSNAEDGDGVAIEPLLETPIYKLGQQGKKRVRRAYVTYDLRDGGANPHLEIDAIFSPESTAYTALTPTFPTTIGLERRAAEVRRQVEGVGLRLKQVGASNDTRIYGIELEGHAVEGSR